MSTAPTRIYGNGIPTIHTVLTICSGKTVVGVSKQPYVVHVAI